ncbi:MAG TPA: hypothetical protein VMM17_02455, partial [Gemmatimonadaceae bacterium]|nr:hypothetical protein [Gemmatimonadaceae bacterium]
MNRVAAVVAAVLMVGTACGDADITTVDSGALLSLVAHDPATHGVGKGVTIQSQHAYADVDGGTAIERGGSAHLTVNAGGSIPRFPDEFITSVAVFGYAWADLQTGAAIVAVIHPVIGRDSRQNPDGWHTHPVQLSGGTSASDFCVVSIGGSQAGIRIVADVMSVSAPAR